MSPQAVKKDFITLGDQTVILGSSHGRSPSLLPDIRPCMAPNHSRPCPNCKINLMPASNPCIDCWLDSLSETTVQLSTIELWSKTTTNNVRIELSVRAERDSVEDWN